MSDFLIDFREQTRRHASEAADLMKYYDDINIEVFDYEKFTLVLSRSDDSTLWSPYESIDNGVFIALSGRIALDSAEWEKAKTCEGAGGLACKAIYQMYKVDGIKSLENLNGSFVALVFDAKSNKFYIITDRCGMFPCFGTKNDRELVISSHADILAKVSDVSHRLNMTSIAEFLVTGKVSFPYSYFEEIEALDFGCIHTLELGKREDILHTKKKYFSFIFAIDQNASEWELAEDLAAAFGKAIQRRTLPIFGQTAISLSGGLDSRTILCSANNKDEIWSFCFYDEENLEFRIAKEIAAEAGVKLIPFKRDFDHYGNAAEMGVTISGGMGDFGSNHYLGFRDAFQNAGIDNIIAGFYCDYLFKGLVLDKNKNKYVRTESLSSFRYEHYMPLFWFDTVYSDRVKERLDMIFPDNIKNDNTFVGKLNIEQLRLFPLYTEPDNQETIIPQRVMGWYLPIVDNDIINVYLKIPPHYKLNTSMFSKMVTIQCGKNISRIMNINTGAKVNASRMNLILSQYRRAIQSKLKRRKKTIVTDESWPNWEYYIYHSKNIEHLWARDNEIADDIFMQILGVNSYKKKIHEYRGRELKLFLRLLTLKLWLDQRQE